MQSKKTWTLPIAGRDLIIESGWWAKQANGAVTVRYGETQVMGTAVMSKGMGFARSYFPLMVDYEEKYYAAGKIKGSRFIKREGRPSDDAVLTGRVVDRTIRPLFNGRMRNDVQVVVTAQSFDGENDPDVLAVIAASTALSISDIPWGGPVAAVRVGLIDGSGGGLTGDGLSRAVPGSPGRAHPSAATRDPGTGTSGGCDRDRAGGGSSPAGRGRAPPLKQFCSRARR